MLITCYETKITRVSISEGKKIFKKKNNKHSFYSLQISHKSKQTQILLSKMMGNNFLLVLR